MDTSIATENPGILFISSKTLDNGQVGDIMDRVFEKAKRIIGKQIDNRYRINVVMYKNVPIYTYVFIDDKRLINIMQGLNTDGTKRLKKTANTKCKAYRLKKETNMKNKKKDLDELYTKYFGNYYDDKNPTIKPSAYFGGYYGGVGQGKLWSDFQEEEDDIKHDYEMQYNIEKLPTLWEKYFDPVHKEVEVLPSAPKEVDDSVISNILEARNVESWVTDDMIRSTFIKYDTKKRYRLKEINGEIVNIYYPIITRTGTTVRVTFDPESNDARYAIHMQRRTSYSRNSQSCYLFFNFPIVHKPTDH